MTDTDREPPLWWKALVVFAALCMAGAFWLGIGAIWAQGAYWPHRMGLTATYLFVAAVTAGGAAGIASIGADWEGDWP